jgi:hypothetical protein
VIDRPQLTSEGISKGAMTVAQRNRKRNAEARRKNGQKKSIAIVSINTNVASIF